MSAACPEEFVQFAGALADASGAVLRRHFRTPVAVEAKADATPVTIADRQAEEALRAAIAARYPDHGIVGEEFPPRAPDAALVWVLDPIDGTRSFISGAPIFGTLIALVAEGRPILGIIDQPILGERWIGAAGRPTRMNDRPARTSGRADLAEATLHTTSPDLFAGADADAFTRLRGTVGRTDYGWDCYAYAQLASGFVDLVVETGLKPHDFLALAPVVEGAGGRMTDWAGAPLGPGSDGRVVAAATPDLNAAARRALGTGRSSAKDPTGSGDVPVATNGAAQ